MSSPPILTMQQVKYEGHVVYHTLAASTLLMWHYCITFGQEVDLVWRADRRWSLINILFLIIRYASLSLLIAELVNHIDLTGALHPTQSACIGLLWFTSTAGPILLYVIELMHILRVYALYNRSKPLLYGLLSLLGGHIAVHHVIVALSVPNVVVVPNNLPSNLNAGLCIVLYSPITFSYIWFPTLVVEGVVFIFVAIKAVQTRTRIISTNHNLLAVFIRDGSWAFLCVFGNCLCLAITYRKNPALSNILILWGFALNGLCGTTLVLNLRSEALKFNGELELESIDS